MFGIVNMMMSKQSSERKNFADKLMAHKTKTDNHGSVIEFCSIVGNRPVNFPEKQEHLVMEIKVAKNENESNRFKDKLKSLDSKKQSAMDNFAKFFGKKLRETVGDFTLYDGIIAFKPQEWSGKNSVFNLGFNKNRLNFVSLRITFDITQFEFIEKSNQEEEVFAKMLLEIKNLVDSMIVSGDLIKTKDNQCGIFCEGDKLDMSIKVNICKPGVFFLTVKYSNKSIEQVVTPIEGCDKLYKKISTYVVHDKLLADVSKDLHAGIVMFYNFGMKQVEILPVHIVLNKKGSNPYIKSFSTWVLSDQDAKESYENAGVANFHPAVSDFVEYDKDKSVKRSIVMKIENVFKYPIIAFRNIAQGDCVIDEYLMAHTILDGSGIKSNNLWNMRNDVLNNMLQMYGVYAYSRVMDELNQKNGVRTYFEKMVRGPVQILKTNKFAKIPEVTKKNVYEVLLPKIEKASCVLVFRDPYIDDDGVNNVLCILNNTYESHVLKAYFKKDNPMFGDARDKMIVISDKLAKETCEYFGTFDIEMFRMISRDKDVLSKFIQSKRDKELERMKNNGNNDVDKNVKNYNMSFSEYNEAEKKPLGEVIFFDAMAKSAIMVCDRRIFFQITYPVSNEAKFDYVTPFIQGNLYLVIFNDFLMLMEPNGSGIRSMSAEDIAARFDMKNYKYEKSGFIAVPWKYIEDTKSLKMLREMTFTQFIKLGVKGGKFYIENFSTIRDICCAFVEILTSSNYEGKKCKSLLDYVDTKANTTEFKAPTKEQNEKDDDYYLKSAKQFVEFYSQVLSTNLVKIIEDNIKANIDDKFNYKIQFEYKYTKRVCLSLFEFVKSVVFGLHDVEDVQDGELIKNFKEKCFPYASLIKSFNNLYTAIKQMFTIDSKSYNEKLANLVFHELKAHLVISVIDYWLLIEKSDVAQNEIHDDPEARNKINEYRSFVEMVLKCEVGHGFTGIKKSILYQSKSIKYPETSAEYMNEVKKELTSIAHGSFYDVSLNKLTSISLGNAIFQEKDNLSFADITTAK